MALIADNIEDSQPAVNVVRDVYGGPELLGGKAHQLRGAAITVGGQAVSSATGFMRMVLLARACSTAEVGLFALAFSTALFIGVAHERLVESGYLICVHRRGRILQRSLLGSTIVISLCFSCLTAIILALSAAVVAVFGLKLSIESSSAMAMALAAAAIAMPPILFRDLARSVAYSHLDLMNAVLIDVLTFVVQVALLLVFWQTGWLGVETTNLAIGVSSFAGCAWWACQWRGRWNVVPRRITVDWREMWAYSRWLLAARALGQGSRVFIPWLVAAHFGAAGAGVLATAITLVGLSWIFVRGVNNYFRPLAVYAYQHGGPSALRRAVLWPSLFLVVFLGGTCVLYGAAGDWLFEMVFDDRQPGVWLVLLLQGFATLAISLGTVASNGLAAIDHPQSTMWVEGATMIVTIALALVLIPESALVGASVAMLAGAVAGAVVAFALFERELSQLTLQRSSPSELESLALAARH